MLNNIKTLCCYSKSNTIIQSNTELQVWNKPYELDSFMKNESQEPSTAAQKFWDAKACAEDNRVRPNLSRFYVKWVRAFGELLRVGSGRVSESWVGPGYLSDI